MARGIRTRADFIQAAGEIVEAEGWPGLSAKSLSARMGTHSTAVYRHFHNWNELVVAVFDVGFGRMVDVAITSAEQLTEPRARILSVLSVIRSGLDADPYIADGIYSILSAEEAADTPHVDAFGLWVVEQLMAMGVPAERIPVVFHAIESTVIGHVLADYTGHPNHIRNRRMRRRRQSIPVFEEMSRTEESVKGVVDDAFDLSVSLILDECERIAGVSNP